MNLILLILTIAENIVIIVIKYQIIMWKGENFNNFIDDNAAILKNILKTQLL